MTVIDGRIESGPGVLLALKPGLTIQIDLTDWRATVNGTRTRLTAEERFWAKVQPTGFCWEWIAAKGPGGYGRFKPDVNTSTAAHRYSYEMLVGPIPLGFHVDHLCRNPSCVNPDHLEPVTPTENVRRGLAGYALRTTCRAGLHDIRDPKMLKIGSSGRPQCRECTRMNTAKYRAARNEVRVQNGWIRRPRVATSMNAVTGDYPPCPTCNAPRAEPCRAISGKTLRPHFKRAALIHAALTNEGDN